MVFPQNHLIFALEKKKDLGKKITYKNGAIKVPRVQEGAEKTLQVLTKSRKDNSMKTMIKHAKTAIANLMASCRMAMDLYGEALMKGRGYGCA